MDARRRVSILILLEVFRKLSDLVGEFDPDGASWRCGGWRGDREMKLIEVAIRVQFNIEDEDFEDYGGNLMEIARDSRREIADEVRTDSFEIIEVRDISAEAGL